MTDIIVEEQNIQNDAPIRPAQNRRRRTRTTRRRRTARNRARRQRKRAIRNGLLYTPQVRPPPAPEAEEILRHLSPILHTYANAVVDPLSPTAIGALKPDEWTTKSLPVTDRITVDIDPAKFFAASGNMITIEGFFIAIIPRCMAAGWTITATPNDQPNVPLINSDTDFNALNENENTFQQAVPWIASHQYALYIGIIGTSQSSQASNVHGYYSVDDTCHVSGVSRVGMSNTNMSALNAIPFSRFDSYRTNADGGRILGAGLKITSEAAPINTGGTVYGGWMTQDDMYKLFTGSAGGAATAIVDKIAQRTNYRGGDGITVRYDPTQSPIQMEYQSPRIDGLTCDQGSNYNNDVTKAENVEVNSQDCCNPGDYMPVAVWKFDDSDEKSTYSIRVEAKIHLQARPTGSCPFLTIAPGHDVMVTEVDDLISNTELFPMVVTSNTFKSFWKTITNFGRKTGRAVSAAIPHINKFLDLANRYVPQAIEMAETYGPLMAAL